MSGWISYDSEGRRQEWRPPTEDSVARKLAEAEAGRLRYCHDARAWFHWDGALWRRDRTGVAARARSRARDRFSTSRGDRKAGLSSLCSAEDDRLSVPT